MSLISEFNMSGPTAHKYRLGNLLASIGSPPGIPNSSYFPDTWVEHLYVSPGGDNGNSGLTPGLPVHTIQEAIDKASTTKHTVIHLLPSFKATATGALVADTIADFDDDAVAAATVTTGDQRLINAWVYIYKSNIHIVGEGIVGSVNIKPAAAASAGIFAIKTGMKNISFHNLFFDATTAAAGIITTGATGVITNLHIKNCRFYLGTIQVDLDTGLVTNVVIENCEFIDMGGGAGTYGLTIAPVYGGIYNCIFKITKRAGAGGKTAALINVANTSGVKGFEIVGNILCGGDDGGSHDVAAIGIYIVGTNVINCIIEDNRIFACDDPIDNNGGAGDTMIGGGNFTPDGEPNSIASGSDSTVGKIFAKSS